MKMLKKKDGFTLVELIVVLVIIGILAAILVPSLTGYIDKINAQRCAAARQNIKTAYETICATKQNSGYELTQATLQASLKDDLAQALETSDRADAVVKIADGTYQITGLCDGVITASVSENGALLLSCSKHGGDE